MKRSLFLTFLLLQFLIPIVKSQQLIPTVISTSGGFYSTPSAMLSFTTGEMLAVETYSSSGFFLTQGFQQSWDLGTAVEDYPASDFSCEIFPNPSTGHVNLVTTSNVNAEMNVEIIDVLGKNVFQNSFSREGFVHSQPLDISGIPQGTYLVLLTWKSKGVYVDQPIIKKIQLVK